MSQDKKPVAVVAADLHLSARPPLFRSQENDWLQTQAGYLRQMKNLTLGSKRKYNESTTKLPVFMAGDIFDKWNVSHETVNMALRELPAKVYAISGNHDLPNHRLEEINRSAYGTLLASERIIDIRPGEPVLLDIAGTPIRIHGFPYGIDLEPLAKPCDFYLEVALVHAYIWVDGKGYPGAKEEQKLGAYKKKTTGYDTVIFGDNHMPMQWNVDKNKNGPSIYNPGGFMVRKSDEKDHRPRVGLLYSDGSIESHYLDISQDNYLAPEDIQGRLETIGVNGFVESLLELGDHALDFASFIHRLLEREKVDVKVKDIILKALDQGGAQ